MKHKFLQICKLSNLLDTFRLICPMILNFSSCPFSKFSKMRIMHAVLMLASKFSPSWNASKCTSNWNFFRCLKYLSWLQSTALKHFISSPRHFISNNWSFLNAASASTWLVRSILMYILHFSKELMEPVRCVSNFDSWISSKSSYFISFNCVNCWSPAQTDSCMGAAWDLVLSDKCPKLRKRLWVL